MKLNRTALSLSLTSLLMASPILNPITANADTIVSSSQVFSDVPQTHWAYPNIVKMALRNVVSGFQDGTFHPDEQVTELQALAMVMQNMGLQSQLATVSTSNLPYTVPDWGKAYVALGIQKGLIDPNENRFSPGQGATREWVAELIVRMIGKASDAATALTTQLTFTDSDQVSDWAKGYVLVASNNGIITGYQDDAGGYSFKPTRTVTRAEMVTLLSKSEKFLNIESATTHIGTLKSLNADSLTIQNSSGSQYTYTITDGTMFYNNGTPISKSDLTLTSQLLVIGDTQQASYVEVKTAATNTILTGTVQKVYPELKSVVVKDENGSISTYQMDDQTQLSATTGTLTDISQLSNGDTVQLTVSPTGKIIQMTRTNVSNTSLYEGTVYDIDPTSNLITILSADNQVHAYSYTSDTYINYKGQRFATIDDLKKGDHVKLQMDQSNVQSIALLMPDITGTIKTVIPDQRFIVVQGEDGKVVAYHIADDAKITVGNKATTSLDSVITGDSVQLTTDGVTVTSLSVTSQTVDNGLLQGTVYSVDTSNRILTLKDANGNLQAYEISSDAVYQIDGISRPTISNLDKDMNISFQLDQDNRVILIHADSYLRGTIVSVDPTNSLITLKQDTGGTKVFVVDPSVYISIPNVSRETLSSLRNNDVITYKLDGSKIIEINVERSYYYTVSSVTASSNRLSVKDNTGSSTTLYLDNDVTLTVPNVSYPTVSDVKVGDFVKATYAGDILKSVEVARGTLGKIRSINPSDQSLILENASGDTSSVSLATAASIMDYNQQSLSASGLHVGDRIAIMKTSDGETFIQLMKRVDATFVSVNSFGDRVYTSDTSYYLPDGLYNNNPDIGTFLHTLHAGDKISIYFINDQVLDIDRANQ